MFPKKDKRQRIQFNPNPQRQPRRQNLQPRAQPSMFGQRQPQQSYPQQNIPVQQLNALQDDVSALHQELETLKQIVVESDKRFEDLKNQVVEIIEYLNQAPQ